MNLWSSSSSMFSVSDNDQARTRDIRPHWELAFPMGGLLMVLAHRSSRLIIVIHSHRQSVALALETTVQDVERLDSLGHYRCKRVDSIVCGILPTAASILYCYIFSLRIQIRD
jgi:hypothetical protein